MGNPFCWIVRGIRHNTPTSDAQESAIIFMPHNCDQNRAYAHRNGPRRVSASLRRSSQEPSLQTPSSPHMGFSVARQRPTSLPFGLLMSGVYYAISFLIGVDLPITASYSQQAASPIGNQIPRSLQLCCTNTPLTPDTGGFVMCCIHSSSPYFVSYCFRAKSKRSGYHLRPTSW